MRTRLMAASMALIGLTVAACGSTSTAAPAAPITIGVSVSLSGDFSGDGKALVQGYDLWAQDENAKGGLQGHKITMKYVDDASSTQQVVTNYQNLITVDKAKSLLEAGGMKTAYYKVYPAETTDFTPIALQVAATKADAVVLGTQFPDAVAFAKTFIQQKYNPKTIIETTGPDQGKTFSDAL